MSIWKVLVHYIVHHYSTNHRFMIFPWLFNRLKLDMAVFQAQSFAVPQSFRLPLNFSLGFENSFRIKLAVATELWHFNRNHHMTFKHDHVVLQCQNWFEVKIVPSGSVVQEGHRMETIYLKITYIDLFLCNQEEDPHLSVEHEVQNVYKIFGSWPGPWKESHLCTLNQTNRGPNTLKF